MCLFLVNVIFPALEIGTRLLNESFRVKKAYLSEEGFLPTVMTFRPDQMVPELKTAFFVVLSDDFFLVPPISAETFPIPQVSS